MLGIQEVLCHWYIEGYGHGWPYIVKQDDDGQRYGLVNWYVDMMVSYASIPSSDLFPIVDEVC